jgi:hypothetical protein
MSERCAKEEDGKKVLCEKVGSHTGYSIGEVLAVVAILLLLSFLR